MKKYYDLLAQTRLFQGIEEQEIGAMLECLQFACQKIGKKLIDNICPPKGL